MYKKYMAAAAIVVVGAVAIFAPSISLVNSQRIQCERGNTGTRQTLYKFLQSAERARLAEANRERDPTVARASRQASKEYRALRINMITSIKDVAQAPGSPYVNCEKAYPKPWPLN